MTQRIISFRRLMIQPEGSAERDEGHLTTAIESADGRAEIARCLHRRPRKPAYWWPSTLLREVFLEHRDYLTALLKPEQRFFAFGQRQRCFAVR